MSRETITAAAVALAAAGGPPDPGVTFSRFLDRLVDGLDTG